MILTKVRIERMKPREGVERQAQNRPEGRVDLWRTAAVRIETPVMRRVSALRA